MADYKCCNKLKNFSGINERLYSTNPNAMDEYLNISIENYTIVIDSDKETQYWELEYCPFCNRKIKE